MPHTGENIPGTTNSNLNTEKRGPSLSPENGRRIISVEHVNHEKFDNVYKLNVPGMAYFFRLSSEGTLFFGNPHELELHQMHQIPRGQAVPGQPWLTWEVITDAIRSTQASDEASSESAAA